MVKNLPIIQDTWVLSLGQEDPLEEKMAADYSILAWRTAWTEEPSRLQSMGSQRVRHDWATNTFRFVIAFLPRSKCLLISWQQSPSAVIYDNLSVLKKQRHRFANKGSYSQSYGFSSRCVDIWELDYKKGWTLKIWCPKTVVLEKTLGESLGQQGDQISQF